MLWTRINSTGDDTGRLQSIPSTSRGPRRSKAEDQPVCVCARRSGRTWRASKRSRRRRSTAKASRATPMRSTSPRSGTRWPIGRRTRTGRGSTLSPAVARQGAAGPRRDARQRDRISLARDGGSDHVDDPRRSVGGAPRGRRWPGWPLQSTSTTWSPSIRGRGRWVARLGPPDAGGMRRDRVRPGVRPGSRGEPLHRIEFLVSAHDETPLASR